VFDISNWKWDYPLAYVRTWPCGDVAQATQVLLSIAVAVTVTWSGIVLLPSVQGYPEGASASPTPTLTHSSVTVQETGLPTGVNWSLTIHRTVNWHNFTRWVQGTSTNLSLPFGDYTYLAESAGYESVPANGSFNVSGANLTVDVQFERFGYDVAFDETGLQPGTNWSVELNGTQVAAHRSWISFALGNGTYEFSILSIGYLPDPESGNVTVAGANAHVDVAFADVLYPALFLEWGLPSNTSWQVTLDNDTQVSSNPLISFQEPNGSYPYAIPSEPGWVASPQTGTITVVGAPAGAAINWTPQLPPSYDVVFHQAGLTSGTPWSVTLGYLSNSSDGSSLSFTEPNGTYSFAVPAVDGALPTPDSGQVTVAGAPISVTLNYLSNALYPVEFSESGLPAGSSWSVNVAGHGPNVSTTASLGFSLTDGNYTYTVEPLAGLTATPSTGQVVVSGASPPPVKIIWSDSNLTRLVVFSERGLPEGSSWSVTLAGLTQSGQVIGLFSNITFEALNGNYAYTVNPVTGWIPSRTFGQVSVAGKDLVVTSVTWTAVPKFLYTVTISESGLPANSVWEVVIDGNHNNLTSSAFTAQEPNGSYSYSVALPVGYWARSTEGAILVQGGPAQVAIVALSATTTADGPAFHVSVPQVADVAVILALVGLTTMVWMLDRRRRASPPPR
jgi:hypothetical protein